MLKDRSARRVKVNQECYALLLVELTAHPSTAYELAEVTGLGVVTIQDLMRIFHRHKLVHISAWEPNGRGVDTTPVWKFGPGKDVPRRRKPRAQVVADYEVRRAMRLMVNLTPDAPAGSTE